MNAKAKKKKKRKKKQREKQERASLLSRTLNPDRNFKPFL